MDIAIQWDPQHFRGDWAATSGDLALDPGGLRSAVLVSLFTWHVASPDYVPPAGSPADRYGWWGDSLETSPVGSRLWQLMRAKKTDSTTLLNQARDYCREALQWLLDDGVAASVDVTTAWLTRDALAIQVTITRPNAPLQVFDFAWAWEGA